MILFCRARALVLAAAVGALSLGAGSALFGTCGPFTDVAADVFCPFVLEIFYLGITTGTTATTYDPAANVTRLQMAAFLSRTVDGVLKRGSRRAGLDQFWTTQNSSVLGLTTVAGAGGDCRSDGADIWVANFGSSVQRVRASDGKLLETWTGADNADGVLVAMGRVLATGFSAPGSLFLIDPSQPAGAVTTVASNLAGNPSGIAFDGARIWLAHVSGQSVSIVTPGPSIPWTVTTVLAGIGAFRGAVYDGANIWVMDQEFGKLLKLDSSGAILQTVTVGGSPQHPAFDGTNIWAPNDPSRAVTVVRASTGAVLQTLTGSGMLGPSNAAFDGQRVLVTDVQGNSVSIWKAADLTFLGKFSTGAGSLPVGACSDGLHFWIGLAGTGRLARF
ncbi:MAG TPA: S-layer homology domain-containing protein [Thermoanaerobaculia bacterium]|nr:S-layer homology domain-containing protein [Thermoanaerobaculia bacterium]